MPASPIDRFAEVGGLRLRLRDWGGDGAPLVLVHGGSAHAEWWDFVAPAFRDRHRVVAVDLRGHGDSQWSADGAYQIADYARDLGGVLATFALERPILVGHSLGSFVALRLALDRPRDLCALVMVDGRATFGAGGSRYLRLLRMFSPAVYETLDEAVEHFVLLPRETSAGADVLRHVARSSYRRHESGGWIAKFDRATLSAHHPFDFRSRLGTLEYPVLFVRGEHSRVLSAKAAADLAGLCRSGEWAEIADAHHHVLLDRPEELASVLGDFFVKQVARPLE